ncbi:hypothetical protein G3O06_20640 [Burkholderia sp. Ac-20345]|uniref:hypothetical protein n=1 Tax=Burkholderia sp. Ac-20345 TaxID=2703891 RepID=UPI00197C57CB|nr:hypothetical protein [Burkholderia sp. Ac-20345]MBN3779948.1 hypothetical protein [Burkholderia sp. Ac-20345]
MKYADARSQIQDGDLIAVRSRTGVMPALIRTVTQSPYTHTAVAVWVGSDDARRLLVAESNEGGCSLSPLSHYADIDFDVFPCPVDRPAALAHLWGLVGEPIAYGYVDLLRIAGNRLLGVPLPPPDTERLICSALSARIFQDAGWKPVYLPTIPAPDDVVQAIGVHPALEVRSA